MISHDALIAVFDASRTMAVMFECCGPRSEWRIVHVNRAFEQFTGQDRAQLAGQTSSALFADRTERADRRFVEEAVWRGRQARAELGVLTSEGRCTPLDMLFYPIKNDAGFTTHALAIASDPAFIEETA